MTQQETIEILIVDDSPSYVDMLGEVLEYRDDLLSVMTATSAREGLRLLNEHEFDCVISDFEMPRMNGIEFLRTIRQMEDDLPFILFTGRDDEEIARKASSAGATEYLQKTGTDQFSVLVDVIYNSVS